MVAGGVVSEVELKGFRPRCGLEKVFGCCAACVVMFQGKVKCGFMTLDVCSVLDQGEG